MATKTPTREEPAPTPVAGTRPWERPDFLPPDSGLPWLDEIRTRHLDACRTFAEAVEAIDVGEDAAAAAMRTWRREVRQAVADGKEPPPRPNVDVMRAETEVAGEDVVAARDALALVVVDFYDTVHADSDRLIELREVTMGVELSQSLARGPLGNLDLLRQVAEERLAALSPVDEGIIDVSQMSPGDVAKMEAEEAENVAI